MTLSELPIEVQNSLNSKRAELYKEWFTNTGWDIIFTNKEGTRYFHAHRRNDFGQFNAGKWSTGGWWEIRYGKILWDRKRSNPFEVEYEYFWVRSGKIFGKSANGTVIPSEVHTKAEVIELAKRIETLVTTL